jgi:excisionase family DNA binding protein
MPDREGEAKLAGNGVRVSILPEQGGTFMTIPKLLTVSEVAAITRAPRASVQAWLYKNRLESVKVGRQRLVTEEALARFIGMQPAPSAPATSPAYVPRRTPARLPR